MTVIQYPQRRTLRDVIMLIVAAIFAPISCIFPCGLCVMIVNLPSLLSEQGISVLTDVEDLQMWGMGCIIAIFCPLLLGYMIYHLLPWEATLTDEAFSYGRRGRVKEMRLDEIVYIGDENRFMHTSLKAWKVLIMDKENQWISLLVGHRHNPMYYSRFDYQVMLRDLLERLPSEAEVSPSVRRFVEMDKPR